MARRARGRPLDELVTWHVDRVPAAVRAGAVVELVAGLALALVANASTGADVPDALRRPRLGAPDAPLDVPGAVVEGEAPWMPARWAGPQHLTCYPDRVTANPRGFDSTEVVLDLSRWAVVGARPVGRRGRLRAPTSRWELTLVREEHRLVMTGPWITLAWIGLLAGWPDPTATGPGIP